jgi:DNA-binding CsgD family transcriptional regulator
VFDDYVRGLSGLPDDPAVPVLMRCAPAPIIAATRQELLPDRAWYGSRHVQELRRAARIDSFLYAGWPGTPRFGALSLHRAWGDRPLGERERALVEAVIGECTFLRQRSPLDGLPPRLHHVLELLAQGLSEKQIASHLDLSTFTVHDHVKALHKRLRVQSRGELLALLLRERQEARG